MNDNKLSAAMSIHHASGFGRTFAKASAPKSKSGRAASPASPCSLVFPLALFHTGEVRTWIFCSALPVCLSLLTPAWAAPSHARRRPAVLMYTVNRADAWKDFQHHAGQIDIIAPQVLVANARGQVSGNVPPKLAQLAARDQVRLLPLIINAGFNETLMDRLLHSPAAERRMVRSLVRRARAGRWWGVQFDFEHIPARDRARYNALARLAGQALHRAGKRFSVTIVPRMSDRPGDFTAGGWRDWAGVYDYRALARASDFLTIMTYSEYSGLTRPGPISGLPWIRRCLRYALRQAPARKISIGAAFYSGIWRGPAGIRLASLPLVPSRYRPLHPNPWKSHVPESAELMRVWQQLPGRWQERQQAYSAVRQTATGTEVVWYSMARSLQALLRLTRRDHLAGISAWRLGQEDPGVWKLLPARRAVPLAAP